jgi:nicotinate-nucleotide--dimethylbenzimidazole phosphoribosyltransferase
VGLRIAAAVAAAGVIAVVVWYALSGGLTSRFGAGLTKPEATPAAPVPTVAESHPVKNVSTEEALAHPAAAPRPAPIVERQDPPAPPAVSPPPVVSPRPVASTPPVASARPATSAPPATVAPAVAPAPAVPRPAEVRRDQSATEGADGSAAIDWLLKRQRSQPITLD